MTQAEKKALAQEIVGDGQLPNKFFVTTSPHVIIVDEYGDREAEILDGYTEEDTVTEVFDSYQEANEYFQRIELDIYDGTTQIMLEDRLIGVIKETCLEKIIKIDYMQAGYDDAKQFGYE